MSARDDGFTLLEVLVTLGVAMILLAAAPRLIAPEAGALRAAERLVVGELRRARETAFTTGSAQAVLVDVAGGTLRRDGARPVALPDGVALRLDTAREVTEARGAPGVLFFGDGGATGGAITLSRGAAATRIAVAWLTGAVDVE